jgi:hypothetical protein
MVRYAEQGDQAREHLQLAAVQTALHQRHQVRVEGVAGIGVCDDLQPQRPELPQLCAVAVGSEVEAEADIEADIEVEAEADIEAAAEVR